jgi:hypothetical protein
MFIFSTLERIDYGMDDRRTVDRFSAGQEVFLFSRASRPSPGSIQSPIKSTKRVYSSRVKWRGREPDHSRSSGAKIKDDGGTSPLRQTSEWPSAKLITYRIILLGTLLYFLDIGLILSKLKSFSIQFYSDLSSCALVRNF